jgi:hypothetical protein
MNPLGDLPSELRRYVRDGRISVIPAKRAARLLLLDQVAQAFEPGQRYSELAVNEILKSVYDDHAALRRYLVDEELLSRTPDGTYWRSGGTVPVSPLAPVRQWPLGSVGQCLPITSDHFSPSYQF